jgi:hypothetical protein
MIFHVHAIAFCALTNFAAGDQPILPSIALDDQWMMGDFAQTVSLT